MRNFMETVGGITAQANVIAALRNGETEGFDPYWKLVADPRVLEDPDAVNVIIDQLEFGAQSGAFPTWELITVKPESDMEAGCEAPVEVEEGMGDKMKDYVKGAAYGAALAAGTVGALTHGQDDLSVANAAVEYGDSEEYKQSEEMWRKKGYDITESAATLRLADYFAAKEAE